MNEKVYRTMKVSGSGNIVIGIISIAVGVAGGILLIISGARLLSSKKDILL